MGNFYSRLGREFYVRLLFVVVLLGLIRISSFARGQAINISATNASLESVCKSIEKQTGYYFVYGGDIRDRHYLVTVRLVDASLSKALTEVFGQVPLQYTIIDKVITISKAFQKGDRTVPEEKENVIQKIRGMILSEQNQALAGATVVVKGRERSYLTNERGEFEISNLSLPSDLIVSYIGYHSKQVSVTTLDYVRVVLSPASGNLDAMIIKGYYNTSNRLNTGNASVVTGDEIAKQPVSDPLLALEGRVPGLSIAQSSGVPGAYSTIRLRGQNSMIQGKPFTVNDPLYVIDGVPLSSATLSATYFDGGILGNPQSGNVPGNNRMGISPFNNLDPLEIESITVLKDADATAIYGSRGANGVILITTKRGKDGVTKIDFNLSKGVQNVTRRLHLLNTSQYLQMRMEAFANDGLKPGINDYDINGAWDTTRYTDWQKELIKTAGFTNMHTNISGGNSNTKFLFGWGYTEQGSVFPGNYSDKKNSFNLNVNNSYGSLKIDLSGSYTYDNNDMPSTTLSNFILLAPNSPKLFDKDGNLNWEVRNGRATWINPLAYTASRAIALSSTLIGAANISYTLFKGLELRTRLGYTKSQMNQNVLTPAAAAPPPNNTAGSRSNQSAQTNYSSWIIEPMLSYVQPLNFGKIEFLMGMTFQSNQTSSAGYLARTFSSDNLINNPGAAASFQLFGSDYQLYRYAASYARIGFNRQDKYLLNVTMRRDGSSKFGPKSQFGNFGAIGIAWVFSKEHWIEDNLPFLSFGKLRGSYGETGNDQVSNYKYLTTYGATGASYQNVGGLSPNGIGNPYFQWERVRKSEVGLELGALSDRIYLTVSAYLNRTNNQLIGYTLPYITGFASVQANLPAVIDNRGVEVVFRSNNVTSKNFSWTTVFNFSKMEGRLLDYPNLQKSGYNYDYSIGRSITSMYLYRYLGVDPQTGTYQFSTKNGSNTPVFEDDGYWSKPITQNYFGGIQNSFKYKSFQADFFVQIVKQTSYNPLKNFLMPGSSGVNQMTTVLDRWQKPGDNTPIQKFSTGTGDYTAGAAYYNNFLASDAVLTDASFLRLKNVSFSFSLPHGSINKIHISNARLYVQCQNLFTVTNYLGMDPETGALNLPPLRTIVGGINITL